MAVRLHALLLGSLLVACSAPPDGPPPVGPSPTSCGFTAAADLDDATDVVEVALAASAVAWDPGTGAVLEGLAYNGTVPGPVIEVTRGQTLRVRFTNDMDEPTTIHWHGLRVAEDMDGVSQMADPVEPGETFTYELSVQDAGFYWYHPHMDTDLALERGLYGTIVAREPGEVAPSCEVPLVLDDVLLDDDGGIAAPSMMDSMGRLGDVLLANGKSGARLDVKRGQTILLRMVNAANARYFRLALPEHVLELVGSDGGWLEEPVVVDELVLAPGERAIVRVQATGSPGQSYELQTRRLALHAAGAAMSEDDPLGDGPTPVLVLDYDDEPVDEEAWAPPAAAVPSVTPAGAVLHRWVLDEEGMHLNTIDGAVWPDVPLVEATAGVATAFEIENRSEMRHPFHLHGQRFQVLAVDDEPAPTAAWKDTVDVPAGSVLRIASELDNPGQWLYHCHILEHAEDGMAGLLTVR